MACLLGVAAELVAAVALVAAAARLRAAAAAAALLRRQSAAAAAAVAPRRCRWLAVAAGRAAQLEAPGWAVGSGAGLPRAAGTAG